jgi:hypothetical protein
MSPKRWIGVVLVVLAVTATFLAIGFHRGDRGPAGPVAPRETPAESPPVVPPPPIDQQLPVPVPASEPDPTVTTTAVQTEPQPEVGVESRSGVAASGWLLGSGGEFLSGGEVLLLNTEVLGSRRKGEVGVEGAFSVDGLDPGEYVVNVRRKGQSFHLRDCRFKLGPAGRDGLEIRLPGRSSIAGRLVDGPDLHGHLLLVHRRNAGEWALVGSCNFGRDGSFVLSHLAAGSYRLSDSGGRPSGHAEKAELVLRDGEERKDVELRWTSGQKLVLFLKDAGGAPLADPVTILCLPAGGVLRVRPETPDEDGRVELGALAPGKLTLSIQRMRGGKGSAQLKIEIKAGEDLERTVRLE